MNDLHLHLTVMNKILIHLMEFRTNREDFEVPYEVTQSGISRAVNIQQKHLPRTLKKLISMNYIEERMNHVIGVKQKRKVYFLSEEGIQYTWEFVNNLMAKNVPVKRDSDIDEAEEEINLQELYNSDKNEFTLLNILLFLDDNGFYNRDALRFRIETAAQIGEETDIRSDAGLSDTNAMDDISTLSDTIDRTAGVDKISQPVKYDIYYTVLKQAWQDGQITKDERDILTELGNKLGISAEEHHKIELEIMSAQNAISPDSAKIYKAALKQAWVDGVITNDEDSLLKELRRTLNISDEQHKILEKELKLNKK
jgi:DNA-binding PadR family transcriptional regulator